MFGFEFDELRIFGQIDSRSKILQVPDPPRAASSAGCLMHLEVDAGQIGSRRADRSRHSGFPIAGAKAQNRHQQP